MARQWRGNRRLIIVAALTAVAALAIDGPPATAATLRLSVQPDQVSAASVVTVTATGTADDNPTSCPAGIGCGLTVFVIRSGSCPAQPAPLVSVADPIVDFLTAQGMLALVGSTPGPFSVNGDYFLDGAPTAAGQGNAADGYNSSPWGTFSFCGYLQDATAAASFTNDPPDELDVLGHGVLRMSYSVIDVFSATCGSPPCQVQLTEQAFAAGRRIRGLDSGPVTSTIASTAPIPVSLERDVIDQALLKRTIARRGSAALHFTATVTDAGGGHTTAKRAIEIIR
jgi:hypothetical protein